MDGMAGNGSTQKRKPDGKHPEKKLTAVAVKYKELLHDPALRLFQAIIWRYVY
jgi:hypothetical protein